MTINELATRLATAAGEVAGIRAELEREQPGWTPTSGSASGSRSATMFEQINRVWAEQCELASRLAEQIQGLAGDVGQAERTYREADRPGMGGGRHE